MRVGSKLAQLIAGRYRVVETIGSGGMGTVYKAKDSETGSTVAIKHLRPELIAGEGDMLERFRREGEALRELNHPNIVKMLDAFEEANHHYLVMDYIAGGDLYQVMKTGQLPIQRILEIGLDIADALTRAHRLDIIHRDLKPANILIAPDGSPRLTDFGVAHIGKKERVTDTGIAIGTVDYLAPEALDGNDSDARADIWAFGVMLFEMLTGQRPFTGNTITQILVSIMTAPIPDLEALRPDAPIALVDLVYRMLQRDVHQRLVSVRQAGVEFEALLHGTPAANKPLATARFGTPTPELGKRKNNLPAQTMPFVGREAELRELARLISSPQTRLVTIVAQGGMGKTRIALEIAQQELAHFTHGAYFVELAPLENANTIPKAIAEAVGYQFPQAAVDQLESVIGFLKDKHLLLILDNYEHLLAGANMVSQILQAAPKMQILVTTREKLNLSEETLFRIEGMDFPEWETPEDALEYSAVKLFMQSARRVRPDFELATDDLTYLARICRLVLGLPLGIVLAASWLEMLSPREIADEIGKNLDFLETDSRNVPERHRSIRAVFDYSWNLMNDAEQDTFMKLAVFRGGFTRMAAEGVASANLRVLMSLMNKSLIHRAADSGRYSIHELLRQYAEERLNHYGAMPTIRQAHADYYLKAVKSREVSLRGGNQREAVEDIELDFENVRAAWWWDVKHNQATLASACVNALFIYSQIRSRWVEVSALFQETCSYLATQGLEDTLFYAKIESRYPFIKVLTHEIFAHALKIIQREQDQQEEIVVILNRGFYLVTQGDFKGAYEDGVESARLAEALGDTYYQWRALHFAGFCAIGIGLIQEAQQSTNKAVEVARASNNRSGMASTLHNVGAYANYYGDWDAADKAWSETNRIQREVGNRFSEMFSRCGLLLIRVFRSLEDVSALKPEADQVLQDAKDMNAAQGIALSLVLLGWIAEREGRFADAFNHFDEAPKHDGNPSLTVNSNTGRAICLAVQGQLEPAKKFAYLAMQFSQSIGAAASFSLTAYSVIIIYTHEKRYNEAAELLAWTQRFENERFQFMGRSRVIPQIRAQLVAELGADGFQAAWERGQAMDWQACENAIMAEFEPFTKS